MSDFPTERGMRSNAAAQQGTGTGAGNTYGTGTGNTYGTDPTYGTGTGNTYGAGTGNTYGTGTGNAYGTGTGTGNTYGTGTGNTYGTGTGTGNTYGTGITYGMDPASGPAPTTAGPHKRDFLNKYDPFVNSTTGERFHPSARADPQIGGTSPSPVPGRERFHPSARADPHIGGTYPRPVPGATGVGTIEGGGVGGEVAGGSSTGTAGGAVLGHAHKSDLLNKLDPRVDSKTGVWKGRRASGGSGGPIA